MLDGFSCRSFFYILCSSSPSQGALSFSSLYKVKFFEKVKFLALQLLYERVNIQDCIHSEAFFFLCCRMMCSFLAEGGGY